MRLAGDKRCIRGIRNICRGVSLKRPMRHIPASVGATLCVARRIIARRAITRHRYGQFCESADAVNVTLRASQWLAPTPAPSRPHVYAPPVRPTRPAETPDAPSHPASVGASRWLARRIQASEQASIHLQAARLALAIAPGFIAVMHRQFLHTQARMPGIVALA